ncbi:hypothetical protein [Romboutsia weinsteinii]|nr:hypothetical protein [Romboutsia weinsteinii]
MKKAILLAVVPTIIYKFKVLISVQRKIDEIKLSILIILIMKLNILI